MTSFDESFQAQQLECFQEVIPVAVLYCQPIFLNNQVTDFRYVWGNRMAHQLSALSPEEFGQMTMLGLFPGLVDSDTFSHYVQVWETGDTRRFERQHPIGSQIRWVDISVNKKYNGLIITAIDITDSKHAQQSKERQTQVLQSIIEQSPAGLVLFQPVRNDEDKIVDFYYGLTNPANARILGLTVEQLTNRNLLEAFPSVQGQGTFGRLLEVLQSGRDKHNTIHYQADGLDLWLESHMTRVGDGVLLTYSDSTALQHQRLALKQQATLLQEKNDQLQQANEALRQTNQRLESLQAIERSLLNGSLTDQEPELAALQYVRQLVPCERLTVFRFDESTGMAHLSSRLVDGKLEKRPGIAVSVDYFKKLEPLLQGQPVIVDHLRPRLFDLPPETDPYELGYRSMLLVPLFSQGKFIGALFLFAYRPAFFTAEHIQIIQEVAGQLAIVLHQRELAEQIHQHTEKLEQRVNQRTTEIQRLSSLQQAILEHTDVAILAMNSQGIVQTVNSALERMLGYVAADLIGKKSPYFFDSSPDLFPQARVQARRLRRPSSTRFEVFVAVLKRFGHFQLECTLMDVRGRPVSVLLTASALRDGRGTPTGYVAIATDISRIKKVEAELRQKNQTLAAFFESSAALHAIANLNGFFIQMNPLWEQVLGYSPAELIARPISDFVHPDDWEATNQQLNEFKPLIIIEFVNRYRHKDGSYRVIAWRSILLGQLIICSARDITQQQQMEKLLLRANQRLELATQAARQGIWEYNHKLDRLNWDRRMYGIYGLEYGEPVLHFQDLLARFPVENHAGLLMVRQTEGTNFSTGVVRIIWPDSTEHYMESHGLIVRNEEGDPVRTVGVAWDVTERIQAEMALRESEQRFRQIAENVDEVFWIYSVQPFQLLYVNPAYERIWGRPIRHLYENPVDFMYGVFEEDRPVVMAFYERILDSDSSQIQYRIQGVHGAYRWVLIRIFVTRDSQGNPHRIIGLSNDITDQKERELVLQKSLEREQELNKLKSQFVSTASHEFRTPLTTIQSSIDLISLYLQNPQSTALIDKHLSVIQQQIDSFDALLSDVLTLEKIEAGKVRFQPAWIDVVALCEQVIATHFSQQKDKRSVHLSMEGIPGRAYLDEKLMGHILVNLLSNAFKFSKNDPRLHLIFREKELIIHVIDQGIGIPAADLPYLFQTFFRAGNTGAIQGTGLGLAITRQFIDLHEGRIEVRSKPAEGTTFVVTIPTEPGRRAHLERI